MSLKQDLSVTMTDCCDTIELCDTTCSPSPCNAVACTDGYSIDGNINKWDVEATEFNITFPDGNVVLGLDFGYLPNNQAYAGLELTAGTTGTVEIFLVPAPAGRLGIATFDTDLPTTILALVNAVNSNTQFSGWSAFVDSTNPNAMFVYNSASEGTIVNGAPFGLGFTGDMAGTSDATVDGGTDDPACKSVTLSDIWALNSGTVVNSNPGPAFADGVYVFEYITYDAAKTVELGRISKTILFDCGVVSCLKETLLADSDCGCDSSYDDRILKTRLKIEQARLQFDEGLFDCANGTILRAGEMCTDVCTGC